MSAKQTSELIFFTDTVPGALGEFADLEIPYLAKKFRKITIFPFHRLPNLGERQYQLPPNVDCLAPLFDGPKRRRIFSGIFNLSPVGFALKELWAKKPFKNIKSLKAWLRETLIVRLFLADKRLKLILSSNPGGLCYFYWGVGGASLIPFLGGYKTVSRFHGIDLYEERKENSGYIPYRDSVLKNITCAIFISEHGRAYLKQKYPKINFKSIVFRLGTRMQGNCRPSDDGTLRIISCSFMIPVKRIEILCRALAELKFPIEWTHIGDGPVKGNIEAEAKLLPANIKTNFLGMLSNKEVFDYYKDNRVDLFVNVSESEGVPVSIMEAMSMGIPIMATDAGGTAELVNNDVGTLLPLDIAPKSLAEKIIQFKGKNLAEKNILRENSKRRWDSMSNADKVNAEFSDFLLNL